MLKSKTFALLFLITTMLSSCQAIGDIFSAGVWIGIIVVVIVIIILVAVFGRKK